MPTGDDLAARTEMMMGALEGGLTFQKGLGAVHALSHALGGLKSPSLHHGTLNAILLPPVLRFNAPAAARRSRGSRRRWAFPPTPTLPTQSRRSTGGSAFPPG